MTPIEQVSGSIEEVKVSSPQFTEHTEVHVEMTKTTVATTTVSEVVEEKVVTATRFHVLYESTLQMVETYGRDCVQGGEIQEKDMRGDLQDNAKVSYRATD